MSISPSTLRGGDALAGRPVRGWWESVSVMTAAIEVLRQPLTSVVTWRMCARGTCRGLVRREGVDGRAAQTSSSSPQPAATMARVEASWR